MATTKTAGPRKGAGRSSSMPRTPKLPPITVAKLEETGRLLERLVSENQQLFIAKGQEFKQAHRDGSSRPLTPLESAQIARVLSEQENPVEATQEVQGSTLRAYDEPEGREILMAAGIGVAPAFVAAVRSVVALIEMPAAEFEQACGDDTLQQAIEERAAALRNLTLDEGRKRASAAFEHYAKSAGFESGEALRLPVQAVWQALSGAMDHLVDVSESSSLIDSAASTAGADETSSTD